MKFNLKNRPRFGVALQRDSAIVFAQKYEEWFEGFEKELHELLKPNPKLGFTPDYLTLHKIIKEILGEAS